MSFSGQYTPLQLNAISGLLAGNGIVANTVAAGYHGTWTPAVDPVLDPAGIYDSGSLVTDTVLADVSAAVALAYALPMSDTTLAALNSIGANSIPALGNAPSATFVPVFPEDNDPFPPLDYPSGTLSYVTDWNRPSEDGVVPETVNEYTITASPSTAATPYFKYGFLGCVARQAYYEAFTSTDAPTLSFIKSWNLFTGYKESQNQIIGSFANSETFLLGNYSNMNDLVTGDLAGITTDFKLFGTDCINLGKTFDLSNAYRWNTPSVLLQTLQRNNAVSAAINFALLALELTMNDITSISEGMYEATRAQEQKIYTAFQHITGDDLTEILQATNCQTAGLRSLADLLDIRYQFPRSYHTLTVPTYSLNTASIKTYDNIYVNNGVNTNIEFRGDYLDGIVGDEIALACGAFSMAIMQVKDILTMDPEAFAQVVGHMERIDFTPNLLENTSAAPVTSEVTNTGLNNTAFGTGPSNTYTYCDFYGAASGVPYAKYYALIQPLIERLTTPTLRTIYAELLAAAGDEATTLLKITAANNEIARIKTMDPIASAKLNHYWSMLGTQLSAEQRAIAFSIPFPFTFVTDLDRNDIYSWVRDLESFAQDTAQCGAAEVITALCDTTTLTGQSIIAAMIEARNAARLSLIGGSLYNDVSSALPSAGPVSGSINDPQPVFGPQQARATVSLISGTVSIDTISGGSGYDPCQPPAVLILPIPGSTVAAKFTAVIDENTGSITDITINSNTVSGYPEGVQPVLYIEPPPLPQRSGEALIPGSLAGSPYLDLVPEFLVTGTTTQ